MRSFLSSSTLPKWSVIASAREPLGSPPPSGLMISQKSEWFAWPAGVVANGRLDVLGQDLEVRQHVLDRPVLPLGARERLVGVVDVGLVVLVVMEPHRLLVDVRLERVVVVRKRRDLVGHGGSFPRLLTEDMLRAPS